MKHTYLAIDLKSFYASVECVERGLDPFTTHLAVADSERSSSTICLAITPSMKQLGIRNRCRLHEIPNTLEYIIAKPRMKLYIDYSCRIYCVYLRYLSPEDIHVYSIDECFLDITSYLSLYHQRPEEFALTLTSEIFKETGIRATVGIGPNLYLSKVAMDIMAKHSPDFLGQLDESSYKEQLWNHLPLTDFWRIGSGTVRRLSKLGIYTMGDIAQISLTDEDILYREFGVDAELLIDHAWGYEPCTIQDIKQYRPRTHSLSSGQILMRNYQKEEALLVLREMTELLILNLVEQSLVTRRIHLHISYDHKLLSPDNQKSRTLPAPTSSTAELLDAVTVLFHQIVKPVGIRKLSVSLEQLEPRGATQLCLFHDPAEQERELRLQNTILTIRHRYGKNALMRASSLLKASTFLERNQQIGGHRA